MNAIEKIPGIRTGKTSELPQLEPDERSHLLPALAVSAEELSSGKGWPDGVSELIARLGRITGANRVWLFQVLELNDKHMTMNFPFEWADDQKYALKKRPRFDTKHWEFETCSPTYRALVNSRRKGEWQSVIIHELDECDFKDYQRVQEVQSTVSIPVIVRGEWWGLFGLDDCTRPRRWSREEIALLSLASHMISSAVIHSRLSSTNRQVEILSHLMESSTWEIDFNSGYCWFNSKILSHIKRLKDNRHLPLLQILKYIHPADMEETFDSLRRILKCGDTNLRQDLRILRDNEYIWSEVIARIILNDEGRLEKMAGIIIDIPERKKKEEELYRKATLDPLTGIANRGSFDKRFTQMIHESRKESSRPFSLLFLDIDHFKAVNDTWGHDLGDQALKHVSRIIKVALRECDFAARIGGEEFAVLLHCEGAESSEIIAERIRRNIEASPLAVSDKTVPLTVSIGIFNSSKGSADLGYRAILSRADDALYEAKRTGRNRVVTSSEFAWSFSE